MKKPSLFLLTGLLLSLAAAPARAEVGGGIAAVVNDSVITMTDVEQRADLYLSGAGQKPSPEERQKVRQQVLNKLIDEALQLQEAKKLGITIDEGQVSNGFSYLAKQNNLSPDEFKKRVTDSGARVDTLYAQIRADIAWSQVVRRQLRPQISISESEIDMTLDQLAQNGEKKQYHVAEIFIAVPDAAAEKDAEAKAEDALAAIKGGEKFSTIARAVSQSPGAANGGDLGWVQEGQLDPAVDKALADMNPGQLSKPVRGENGYHVIFLREMRNTAASPPVAAPAPAAKPAEVIVSLKQIVIPASDKDSEDIIKAKFARGVALKKEAKNCGDMEKLMKEFPGNGTGSLGTGPEKALQPELRAIVSKLKVNELSAPIHADTGWAMLMVCSRENAAAPVAAAAPAQPFGNLASFDKGDEKARESVADRLGGERLGKMADHYLHDLRASAFIDKRI